MKKHTFVLIMMLSFLVATLSSCENKTPNPPDDSPTQIQSPSEAQTPTAHTAQGKVIVSFDYENQSGWASNQFAVWIEDMDGKFITTLYATKWTATGGYKTRPDSIPIWVKKFGVDSMQGSDVDAVSGATPRASESMSFTWDLTDANGNIVPIGEYKFFVEGTLRWKNQVMYSGVVDISGDSVTVEADAVFTFEASDGQDVLTENSPETNMITAVKADFLPASEN